MVNNRKQRGLISHMWSLQFWNNAGDTWGDERLNNPSCAKDPETPSLSHELRQQRPNRVVSGNASSLVGDREKNN